jgi:glycosyltransferase involved in cell wall biosynthesis
LLGGFFLAVIQALFVVKVLFVHQNFPGQYRHIIYSLSASKSVQLLALGVEPLQESIPDNIKALRYPIPRGNTAGIHEWVLESETKVIRGEACARAAHQLSQQGYTPNLICAHPGWGESLFLREIWPGTPILHYQEFYYQSRGFDLDFDPATQGAKKWEKAAKGSMKNAAVQLALEASSWNVCPTAFQRSTFPTHWQESISVIHDGIDTNRAQPNSSVQQLKLPDGTKLRRGEPIISFVNRSLEPYRGCHTFIRAIPELQRRFPKARIVIVGRDKGVSYGAVCPEGEWKDLFLAEIQGQYNPSRVHFTGQLPYKDYLQLLQLSQAHVYLTYPFVLSWSLLEAMSTQCAIVGSATAPVQEVIQHGHNGLLVDFFDHQALAESVADLLNNRELAEELGRNARATTLKDYSLEQCVPRHLALMELVASGALSRR